MSIRMRHTRGHTNNRRSHHALVATSVVKDKESGNLRLPHHLDEVTGMYRGKQIFTPKVKAVRVEKNVKGVASPAPEKTVHDHTHDHANAELKVSKGSKGRKEKFVGANLPKARSGFGGGA